jgi:phage-related protein
LGGILAKSLGGLAAVGKLVILPAILAQTAVAAGKLIGALAPASGVVAALPGLLLGAAVALGTLKIALSGVGDALKAGLSGDAEKFGEAMAKLAPNAQSLVKTLVELQPAFNDLKKSVQQNFFAGFAEEVKNLATAYLPVLKTQLPAIASAMGVFGLNAAQAASQASNVSAVATVMDSVGKAIGRAADGIGPLISGLLQASTVAAPAIESLGNGFANLATKFGDFLSNATATGQLQATFQTAIGVLSNLGSILSNVGGILKSVFSAASAAGGDVLGSLYAVTGALNTFLASAQGLSALQAIFGALAQVGAAMSSTLGVVLPLLGQAFVALAPALGPLVTGLGGLVAAVAPILPVIGTLAGAIAGQLTTALASLTPVISTVVNVLGGALGAVLPQISGALLQVVAALAPLLPPLAQLIAQLLTGLVPALTPLIVLLGQIAAQIGGVLVQALQILLPPIIQIVQALASGLTPILKVLGDALVQILTALLPLLPPLVELLSAIIPIIPMVAQLAATLITALLPAIIPIIELIVKLATLILSILTPALNFLISTILGPVIGALSSLIGWLGKVIGAVVGFVANFLGKITEIPGKVVSALGNVGRLLYNAGQSIIRGLIDGLASMIGAVGDTMSSIVGKVRNFLPFSPAKEGPLSGEGSPEKSGQKIVTGIASGIRSEQDMLAQQMASVASGLVIAPPAMATRKQSPGDATSGGVRVWSSNAVKETQPLVIESGGSKMDDLLVEVLTKAVRVRGGDVQRVLGKTAVGVT